MSTTANPTAPATAPAKLDIPAAPRRLPVIGHALSLAGDPMAFLESLQRIRARTGRDMALVHIGNLPVVFLLSSERVHEILVAQAGAFEKGRFFDKLRDLVGLGLATSEGDRHRTDRRTMQQVFRRERIAEYSGEISERARVLADSVRPGQVLDVDTVVTDWAADCLARLMVASDIGEEAIATVRRDLPIMLQSLLVRTVTPRLLDRLPLPANRRFDAATARLHKVLDEVIAAARRRGVDPAARDLLSVLMTAQDPETGARLTDEGLRDQLGSILFAGVETTASLLSWALYDIARHPEVDERLIREIREVVGTDGRVTHAHAAQLPYLSRVVNEVLRMHSVTVLMRRSIRDVEIGGTLLPAGTEVAFSLYAIYRDPAVFEEPTRFDPDRWVDDPPPRGTYTPFGAGARKCIGDGLALTQAHIALATLLARWRLEPVDSAPPQVARAAVPHPSGLRLRAVARER